MRTKLVALAGVAGLAAVLGGGALLAGTGIAAAQALQPGSPAQTLLAGESAQADPNQGSLGIAVTALSDQFRQRFSTNATQGVGIVRALPDGAAVKAGLKEGDVIVWVAGVAVNNPDELRAQLQGKTPNTAMSLSVQTGNAAARDLQVTLLAPPQRPDRQGMPGKPGGPGFGFGQNGAQHTVTAVQGTVKAVSASSITITIAKNDNGGDVTYSIDAQTRIFAGQGKTAATDLTVDQAVTATTFDGQSVAKAIVATDAVRQGIRDRQGMRDRMPANPAAPATPGSSDQQRPGCASGVNPA